MAAPNSGPRRVQRQSVSQVDMPPTARPILTHRPYTYPSSSSSTSQATLSTSAGSSGFPLTAVIDPSLLAAPQPPLMNGGINLAMVAPSQSPHVTPSSFDDSYENHQDYFGLEATAAAAGPSSTRNQSDQASLQQWHGYDAQRSTTTQDWQQQSTTTLSRSSQEPEAPYDLARKKDGKIARPPNAWILYRSEMLKQLIEGKQVEGLEAALEELNNPPAEAEDSVAESEKSKRKARKPKKPPAKGVNELIRELGSGKGGRGLPQAEISRVISVLWKRESPERRRHYDNLAAQAKEEHKRLYPGYKFQPMRKDEKAAYLKFTRQQRRDGSRRSKVRDKVATKTTRRPNSRHKRSSSTEYSFSQLDRVDSYSSQSSDQGFLQTVPIETLGSHQGYSFMAGQPYATPLMSHLVSTPMPSSSRSGSIALSLPGTSSTPEPQYDFVVDRGLHLSTPSADMPYDSLLPQSMTFSDVPPMMGYSTLGSGYGGSEFIPGRPLPYAQLAAEMPDRLVNPTTAAIPYHYTQVKVPAQYLTQSQGNLQYTEEATSELAYVWCDMEDPAAPSPMPPAANLPVNLAGETGQSWAEHERAQGASMLRISMAPPGAIAGAGPGVGAFVSQYQNGSNSLAGLPQQAHLEVPRMAQSVHGSPLCQPMLFDPARQAQHTGAKPELTPSPAIQHAMIQRAPGGDTLGQGLLPSPVDHAFPIHGVLRNAQGASVPSPQPGHLLFDSSSSSNLVPRQFSNSIFPLSPTGTQLPQWAQDRSFSSSSQQAQIMPSMSLSPGQILGDDWEESGKPSATVGNGTTPRGTSVPPSNMSQPGQRRVVSGLQQPSA